VAHRRRVSSRGLPPTQPDANADKPLAAAEIKKREDPQGSSSWFARIFPLDLERILEHIGLNLRTRTCTVQKGGGEASPTPRSTDVSAPLLPPLGAPLLTPNGVPRRHDDAPLRIAAFRTRRRSGIGARRGQRVAVHAALSIRTGHRAVQCPSRRGFLGQLFFRRRIEKGTGERVAVRQRPPCLTDN
jgi:hypothetical protein